MRGKIRTMLILPLIASLLVTFAMLPASAQTALLRLNPIIAEPPQAQAPGGTFIVSIEVDDVIHMLGYEFRMQWNPGVLAYANYLPNEPFVYPWPATIIPGRADIAWSYFPGELVGFNTTDPYPIGTFVFNVVGTGYSELDLKNTVIIDVYGETIDHTVADGYFINQAPVVKLDLTAWKAKAKYQPNWNTVADPINQLRARIWNKGTIGLMAKVVFTITKGGFSKTEHSNIVYLPPGTKATVYYNLDFATLAGTGTYTVTAQASYWKITGSQPVTPNGATIKTFNINAN